MRKLIISLGIISFLSLTVFVLISDYNAKNEFCDYSFNGKITDIKLSTREYYYVKINDVDWFFLGDNVFYNRISIEKGDTLIKKAGCSNIILKKNGLEYKIGTNDIWQCECSD